VSTEPTSTLGEEGRYRAVRELALDAPDAVKVLLARLSDESWRVRKAAVDRLAELKPVERALPHLIDALGLGDDAQARNAAAEALSRIGSPAVKRLAERLGHGDADVRKFAADILGEIGHAEAVEPLAQALDDSDRNVRAAAAEALGKIGGPRAGIALERALKADDHLLRVSALDGLSRIGAVPRTETLEPLARDRFLRRSVYRLLGRQTGDRALALLLAGVADPGRSNREAALAAIAEQARRATGFFWGRLVLRARREAAGASVLRTAAREALGRSEAAVVEGAILVLGALDDAGSAVPIAELGGAEAYRDAARLALAGLGSAAVAPLVEALETLRPSALGLAAEILGEQHGPALAGRALQTLDGALPELAVELLELLGEIGGPEAVEGLLAQIDDPLHGDPARRALAGIAARHGPALRELARALWNAGRTPATLFLLGEVGEQSDLAQVEQALNETEASMRVAAVRALAARGQASAAEAIASALTDESGEVRAAALRALARLGHPRLEIAVQSALADASPRVAQAAAETAGRARLKSLAPTLVALLERGQGAPAMAALDALERLEALDTRLLERASEHMNAEVCRAAMELCVGRASGIELLRARLGHARWEVRRAAARVAGRVGEPALLPELEARLTGDSDPLVVEALHQAISAIRAREL